MTDAKDDPVAWLESRPAVEESFMLYRDDEAEAEHRRAKTTLATAEKLVSSATSKNKAARNRQLKEAKKALTVWEEEAVASGRVQKFTFTSIGADAVDALEWKHPPTEAQLQQFAEYYKKRGEPMQDPGVDLDGYSIELIAKSCIDPKLSQAKAKALYFSKRIQAKERSGLINAARRAQGAQDDVSQLMELVGQLGLTS